MASRTIHLAICNEIKKKIQLKQEDRFTIGQLLPDAVKDKNDKTRDISHYVVERLDGLEGYQISRYWNQYKQQLYEDDLYIGYYIHLLQDDIWYEFGYEKWNLLKAKKEDKDFYKKIYMDYAMTNQYIIQKYKLTNNIKPITEKLPDIMEFDVENWLKELNKDFQKKFNTIITHYLKPENIDSYISECVNICIEEIQTIYSGKD